MVMIKCILFIHKNSYRLLVGSTKIFLFYYYYVGYPSSFTIRYNTIYFS